MPQDIPLESSDTLVPEIKSLASLGDTAPRFVLRTPTPRDKRFHQRLNNEEGLRHHSPEAIRAEILTGLKALWTEEQFAEHAPRIQAYWTELEDFQLQLRDDPDLEWTFDPALEKSINGLISKVGQSWRPLRAMLADNAEFAEMSFVLMVAIVVKDFSNLTLKTPREMDRGYLTVDTAYAIRDALWALEDKHKLDKGVAWLELSAACTSRMYLDEDEEKNSESPSPSKTPPALSSETSTLETDGKSPASAPSSATPASE